MVIKKKGFTNFALIFLVALILIGFLGYVFFKNKPKQKIDEGGMNVTTPTQTLIPTPKVTPDPNKPDVLTPLPESSVSSPLAVKGTVPSGWMFEGVFPVKLLDDKRKLITQVQGKEITPGSWQNGNRVDFQATITFSTNAKTGFLILENDNPSGLPENSKSLEIPVVFSAAVSKECGVCGPSGIHNVEGSRCAEGLVCKNGITTSASYCVKPENSVAVCENN